MRIRLACMLSAVVVAGLQMPASAQTFLSQLLPNGFGGATSDPGSAAAPISDDGAGEKRCAVWTLESGAYFVQPFGANAAFYASRSYGNVSTTDQRDFSQSMIGAPLAILSCTGSDGWGFRVRWFNIEANDSASTVADGNTSYTDAVSLYRYPVANSPISAQSHLGMGVYDFEATRCFAHGPWQLLTSGGIRYTDINQSYSLNIDDLGSGLFGSQASHSFRGFGPTLAIEGRRQLGDLPVYLYGGSRGSFMWGTGNQSYETFAPTYVDSSQSDQTSGMIVAEVEAGTEWSQSWGRFRFFAQVAFVGQFWFNLNTPGNNTLGSALNGTGISYFTNTFGFIGGVGRAGISF